MKERPVDLISRAQPATLEHGEVTGQADRNGRENGVERDCEPELNSRELQGVRCPHGLAGFQQAQGAGCSRITGRVTNYHRRWALAPMSGMAKARQSTGRVCSWGGNESSWIASSIC